VDAAPVVARGHNLAILVPPVPTAAMAYLQAIPDTRPTLVLTADADRAVAFLDAALQAPRSRPALAVTGLARAQRLLTRGLPALLFVSAADALRLLKRSALKASEFQTVVLAWPEQLDEEGREALETVLAEVDRESQRLMLVGSAGPAVEALIERYAFKAVTFGFPPAEAAEAPPPTLGPASYLVARAGRLEATRRSVLDALDPASDDLVIVAPCPGSREAAEALSREAVGTEVGGPKRLVFVVEPSQLAWLRGLFSPLTPLRLPAALDDLERRADAVRATLTRTLERESLDRELFLIGPLLDRFDPAVVAAAALHLAGPLARTAEPAAGGGRERETEAAPDRVPSWAKLWVGVGRKDNVRPGDVLGAIVGEAKIAADRVGKIEVRELYCLVEVRSDDAERVARSLTGTTLRGRRLTARVDRGHAPSTGGAGGGGGGRFGRSLG
jgi:DbpA-like RNA binding protein